MTRPGAIPSGRPPSHRKVANDFISFLEQDCNDRGSARYTREEMREAFMRSGLRNSRPTIEEFLDALNQTGELLMENVEGKKGWRVACCPNMTQR